jgi:hypothetical protein
MFAIAISTPAHAAFIMDTGRVKNAQPQTPPSGGGEGSASAVMGAKDQAAINRIRSMIGPSQYRPKVVCSNGDVNIGTNSKQPTYVGVLEVVSGGACPRNAQQLQ